VWSTMKRKGSMPVPRGEDIKALGASITYLRRYSLQAMLGVAAEEDTDGPQDGHGRVMGRELGLQVRCRQTNHEGEYIGFLHQALGTAGGVIVNPGAWTHYSWAIHDALEPFEVPFVEVHLSDVNAREDWRKHSVLEGLGGMKVVGKGFEGYREALALLAEQGS